MASWDPTELMLIFAIALIILGPRRLPEIASKIGGWVGKARRMTRVLKRQLEEELDMEQGLNVRPKIQAYVPPNDDDTFSPMHGSPSAAGKVGVDTTADAADGPQASVGTPPVSEAGLSDEPPPGPETGVAPEPDKAIGNSAVSDTAATDKTPSDDDGERRAN